MSTISSLFIPSRRRMAEGTRQRCCQTNRTSCSSSGACQRLVGGASQLRVKRNVLITSGILITKPERRGSHRRSFTIIGGVLVRTREDRGVFRPRGRPRCSFNGRKSRLAPRFSNYINGLLLKTRCPGRLRCSGHEGRILLDSPSTSPRASCQPG